MPRCLFHEKRYLPFFDLLQDKIGYLLVFHLVSVTCFLDEYEVILIGSRHISVEILEKLYRVSIGEVIVSPDEQRPSMRYPLCLREVTVWRSMDASRMLYTLCTPPTP